MPKPILLVEDDRTFAILAKSVLKRLRAPNKLIHLNNGREALEYLRTNTDVKPCVILLDLYMPRMNGIEFMRVVKSDPGLKNIPIVVLTVSPSEADVAASFELGAAEYLIKGEGYNDLLFNMSRLMPYWAGTEVPAQTITMKAR